MTITTAQTPDQFRATLQDRTQLETLLKSGNLGQFVIDYAEAVRKNDTSIADQVKEQVEATVAQMLKDNRSRIAPVDLGNREERRSRSKMKGAARALYNKRAHGAVLDGKADDLADFFQANWHNVAQLRNAEELMAKQAEWRQLTNSFSTSVPDAGGFLVPEEFRSDIMQTSLEDAIVRPRATVIPMSSLTLALPAVDETTHSGSVFGGITAYWTEAGTAATESQASFGRVKLEASKLVIYCEPENELIADAPAFNAWLEQQLPAANVFEEDYAFLSGTGTGQPKGVLNGSGLIAASRNNSNKIDAEDVISMYARMLPSSIPNAVWLVAPDAIPQLMTLVMPTGDTTTTYVAPPLFLPNQSLIGPMAGTLLGRPVIVTEKTAKLGSAGDLALIDFKQYLIGDRMTWTLTSSPHFKFSSDKTAYKLTSRVDGRPWLQSAITPRNGSTNTLSAYVKLAA